jgi:hypothetical protein
MHTSQIHRSHIRRSSLTRSHSHTCLGSGLLVVAVLASTAGVALAATKTVIKAKGMEANAAFDTRKVVTCVGGSTALDSMSVHISMFETTTTTDGSAATVLQTSMSVSRFDGCSFEQSSGAGLFTGIGTLQLTALQSGQMLGNFVLDDGTRVGVNLTLTGSDTSSFGTFSRRSILGKTMVLQRSVGASRTATVSGTVTVDGQTVSGAQMIEPSGGLGRNTGGEITILKP